MKELIREALAQYEPQTVEVEDGVHPAGVLLLIYAHPEDGPHVVFQKRTDHVDAHKGQISFPGGGADPEDVTPLDTALRELGGPTVIAGDCNMWGPPIAAVLRGRRRAVRGRTWPAPRPHSQIDHIWIDRHLRALDGRVGDDVGSDHRPVRATLAFVDGTP